MLGFMKKVSVKGLEAKSEAVFNVLNAHNVFGPLDGTRLEVERRGFVDAVISHAVGSDIRNYLELTYNFSCVRLIIKTTISAAGEANFSGFDAYDHPWNNDTMDYDALNADIRKALNAFALFL
jgi:hypothetical protein